MSNRKPKRPASKPKPEKRQVSNADIDESTFAKKPDSRFKIWKRLVAPYSGTALLTGDPIYALPQGLIDAICIEVPGLFTEEEERLERSLANLAGLGFFLERPIAHPSLTSPLQPLDVKVAETRRKRHRQSADQIRDMQAKQIEERGFDQSAVENYFATHSLFKRKVDERQAGYAGWLVTSPDFHRERDDFRNRWEQEIKELGRFPKFPTSIVGERPTVPKKCEREFYSHYTEFYKRWGLDTFATWELPIPMRPDLTGASLYPLSDVSDAGVVIFAPWYLLRDKDITLRELAEHKIVYGMPRELQPWVEGNPKNWGHDRYRSIFELYVYLELCLKSRYSDRLNRKYEEIDFALSRFYCAQEGQSQSPDRKQETIRKIRLEMARRINACKNSS